MESLLAIMAHLFSVTMRAQLQTPGAEAMPSAGPWVRELKIEGDIILGGLFPVHGKGLGEAPCGDLNTGRGIHRVEAMLYALDRINLDPTILPHHKLGALILDTCSTPAFALNQSLDFVRDLMGTMDTAQYECPGGGQASLLETPQPVAGVIGGSYSSVSIQVANLLRLFRIVQISPASTNADLSDKSKFEYFARTVPSDNFQAKAMADIAAHFNWSYVSLVYSAGEYGELGAEAFKRQARHMNICIAAEEKISKADDLPRILQSVREKARQSNQDGVGARVVILFTRNDDTKKLLIQAEQSLPKVRGRANVIWLASDGWEPQDATTRGLEEVAENAIVLTLASQRVAAFEDYFLSLDPGDPDFRRNPWLPEFWERTFACSLNGEPGRVRCHPNLRLTASDFSPDNKIQFVIDAVKALATALDMMWRQECSEQVGHSSRQARATGKGGACSALSHINGADLYQTFLLNVSFQEFALRQALGLLNSFALQPREEARGPVYVHVDCPVLSERLDARRLYRILIDQVSFINTAGKNFKFDEQGDGPAYYRILNYRRSRSLTGDALWEYVEMGSWHDGELDVFDDGVLGPAENATDTMSICSAPCKLGEKKSFLQDTSCCWVCIACKDHEYMINETTCADCGEGHWPFDNRSDCYDIALKDLRHMEWGSIYSIAPCILASIGALLTLQVIAVFIRFNDTPVVKASGRELSYILLGGMIVCYIMTFVLLAKPTAFVCGLKRVGVGFGFAVLYSAMLVKTNRIYRIFASAKESAQRPKWISPISQCGITALLAGVQLFGSLLWLAVDPPATRHHYPNRKEVVLMCGVGEEWFLVSLGYDLLLIVTCTFYAIQARKVPENFNEAKFIGFTMYTTCIIWLAFIPIYFGTGSDFQIQTTTLCISISLSSTVALFCLYSPKLWIILMEPEKNVRKTAGGKPMMSKATEHEDNAPSMYSPLLSSTATPASSQQRNNIRADSKRRPSEQQKNVNCESLESLTSL